MKLGLGLDLKNKIGGGGGGAPFDVLNYATEIWLDAQDNSTIHLNGGTIEQWDDKSGNNKHATETNGTYQPYTSTAYFGGEQAVFMDYYDRFRIQSAGDFPYLHGGDGVTIFLVHKMVYQNASYQIPIFSSLLTDGLSIECNTLSQAYNKIVSGGTTIFSSSHSGAVLGTNENLIMLEHGNALSNNLKFWLDGTNVRDAPYDGASPEDPANGGNVITLGYAIISPRATMAFGEVIVLSQLLDTADRQKFEGYLAHKWNQEGDLPAGHPYKSAPPE